MNCGKINPGVKVAPDPSDIYPCETEGFGLLGTKHDPMKSKKTKGSKRANKMAPSRKLANRIMEWCLANYGKSRYNRYFPDMLYRNYYPDEDPRVVAFYDEQESIIFIKKNEHRTAYQLANSIIHEYTHYKQNSRHYNILSMYLPYHENPLEIEANEVAKRDAKKCLQDVMGKKSTK